MRTRPNPTGPTILVGSYTRTTKDKQQQAIDTKEEAAATSTNVRQMTVTCIGKKEDPK
jgi:hypothetical protein